MSGIVAKIVSDWSVTYPDPLVVSAGDQVTLGRVDTEWPFIWCTNSFGKSGWIPLSLIKKLTDDIGICQSAYSTKELAVIAGEEVLVESDESGWSWVTNRAGESGWIPNRCLAFQPLSDSV